jgi:hypothetical protein
LGIQPTGSDFTPGSIILRLTNNTGLDLKALQITYDAIILNNENNSNSISLQYSLDNLAWITTDTITSNEAKDASPSWVSSSRNSGIIDLTIEAILNNSYFYIKWLFEDVSGSENRDELSIDNIIILADN